jgi:putative peptide zinc metalloprotease protein
MPAMDVRKFCVIPLTVQKEGEDLYVIGSVDLGDFYQFPEQGVKILNMLQAGDTASTIKSALAAEGDETIDVDGFVDQLLSIGFIYQAEERDSVQSRTRAGTKTKRWVFSLDPRLANAIFSPPALLCYLAIVAYAFACAIAEPQLRINFSAFYTDTNRTLLLLLIAVLSLTRVILHELGHMIALARHGIKSEYGIGNRLWDIVAEADLTGLLTLPKSQRYFPMLAGMLVDVLCMSIFTITLQLLLHYNLPRFAVQVVQACVLEATLSIAWQFNIFVKTDIYYILCNYFSSPDLDKDARAYLKNILYLVTLGRCGNKAVTANFRNLMMLRVFSLIWLFGRILSLLILVGVFLPTIWRYIESASKLLRTESASFWIACDMITYASITLSFLAVGMYVWLKQTSMYVWLKQR